MIKHTEAISTERALKMALEALGQLWLFSDETAVIANPAITALREALAEPTSGDYALGYAEGFNDACKPAQREPVAFPTRKAVEREIERTTSPTGMHLNDGKERVALPGGTLRHMLALIDRTSPPQRIWIGLTHEEHMEIMTGTMTTSSRMAAVEAKLKEKNSD